MTGGERLVQGSEDQLLTVKEVEEQYRGRWVLGQVTGYDEYHRPSQIRLIKTSKSRNKISKVLEKLPRPSQQEPPQGPYYVFHAGPPSSLSYRVVKAIFGL